MQNFLNFKSEEERQKILNWITSKNITCDSMNIENLVNIISCCKTNLNEEISYCINLPDLNNKLNNLYVSSIKSKNKKLDGLVDLYNSSNTYNKINFVDNIINFYKTTHINKIKIEFENFDFFYPLSYKMNVYTYDQIKLIYDILPYNYYGLYSEYFDSKKDKSIFKVANKNTFYIYDCVYNNNGFQLGEELSLQLNYHYGFKDDYLILDRDLIKEKDLIIKYQPAENSFEFAINKKIIKIELEVINDKLNLDKKIKKKLVIL